MATDRIYPLTYDNLEPLRPVPIQIGDTLFRFQTPLLGKPNHLEPDWLMFDRGIESPTIIPSIIIPARLRDLISMTFRILHFAFLGQKWHVDFLWKLNLFNKINSWHNSQEKSAKKRVQLTEDGNGDEEELYFLLLFACFPFKNEHLIFIIYIWRCLAN